MTRKKPENENKKPRLDESFIKEIEGNEFVVYSGLLDLAHQEGLVKLEVEPVQYPAAENGYTAICRAYGETKSGGTFKDVGDADPTNTSSRVRKHLLRMASTRAKARVLRDMTNIGMTCLEELADLSDTLQPGNGRKPSVSSSVGNNGKGDQMSGGAHDASGMDNENPSDTGEREPTQTHSNSKISEAQRKAILNLGLRRKISEKELDTMARTIFAASLDTLSASDASSFIQHLQHSA